MINRKDILGFKGTVDDGGLSTTRVFGDNTVEPVLYSGARLVEGVRENKTGR